MNNSCVTNPTVMRMQLDKFIQVSPVYLVMRGDTQAAATLKVITDLDRRMAAFWNYVRYPKNKGRSIAEAWAWDKEQIAAYEKSPERRAAGVAIAAVKQLFADDPKIKAIGEADSAVYTLWGEPDPRPLETQLNNWQRSDADSVKEYGRVIREHLVKEMSVCGLAPVNNGIIWDMNVEQLMKFGQFIEKYADSSSMGAKSPVFATPGLSDHGRSRAVDFKVIKHGQGKPEVYLGANSKQADRWRSEGCAGALTRAVNTLNQRNGRTVFKGPLSSPDEPWHWVYQPAPEAGK
jgi:hypothetical protein